MIRRVAARLRPRGAGAALLAAPCCLAACAPTLADLVSHDRFDEAVCAVTRFELAQQQPELVAALRAEFDVALHLEALAVERAALLAPKAAQALQTASAVVRARLDTRASASTLTPTIWIALARGSTALAPAPVDLDTLAALGGEKLPGPAVASYGPSGIQQAADAVQTAGAVASSLMDHLTLGVWSLTPFNVAPPPSRPSGSYTVEPSDEQLARAAPEATALLQGLARADEGAFWGIRGNAPAVSGAALRPGQSQSLYAIWHGPDGERLVADALLLTLRYSASAEDGSCELVESIRLPLPQAADLAAQLRALFGARLRRLSELRAMPGTQVVVTTPDAEAAADGS